MQYKLEIGLFTYSFVTPFWQNASWSITQNTVIVCQFFFFFVSEFSFILMNIIDFDGKGFYKRKKKPYDRPKNVVILKTIINDWSGLIKCNFRLYDPAQCIFDDIFITNEICIYVITYLIRANGQSFRNLFSESSQRKVWNLAVFSLFQGKSNFFHIYRIVTENLRCGNKF